MKYLVTAAFILILVAGVRAQRPAETRSRETAMVEFTDRTKLADVVLQGKYLFEHDDSRMARGEACMFVYTLVSGKADQVVVSFHCKPVERAKVKAVVTSVAMTSTPDLFELKEIQFAGSTKGHIVP
jgi:hypothetical protein